MLLVVCVCVCIGRRWLIRGLGTLIYRDGVSIDVAPCRKPPLVAAVHCYLPVRLLIWCDRFLPEGTNLVIDSVCPYLPATGGRDRHWQFGSSYVAVINTVIMHRSAKAVGYQSLDDKTRMVETFPCPLSMRQQIGKVCLFIAICSTGVLFYELHK